MHLLLSSTRRAAELFAKAEKNSKDEYDHLKKLVTLYAGKIIDPETEEYR